MNNAGQQTEYPAGKYEYTVYVNGKQIDVVNIPEDFGITIEDWNEFSDEEKKDMIKSDWEAWLSNYIDGGFELKEVKQ